MSSLGTLRDANTLAKDHQKGAHAVNDPLDLLLLHHIFSRGDAAIKTLAAELRISENIVEGALSRLVAACLVRQQNDIYSLTDESRLRLDHTAFSLNHLVGKTVQSDLAVVAHPVPGSYRIIEEIGRGATSVTFKAEQLDTHSLRTLKCFRPDSVTWEKLDDGLKKRGRITDEAIPEVITAGQLPVQLPDESIVICPCVVLRYIEGDTFSVFLERQETLDKSVPAWFIRRVGGALAAIEIAGLSHGDLHERNILVSHEKVNFWVIDFIGVPSSASKELYVLSDLENFRNHLMRMCVKLCQLNPGVSARTLLGENTFRTLDGLRNGRYKTFAEMLSDFERPVADMPTAYFGQLTEQPFEWLRVEQIPKPVRLHKLFEPAQVCFGVISRFGNTWITGPPGSGKSHYLRVLEFNPDVVVAAETDTELASQLQAIKYDIYRSFGVLIACRIGEFKVFSPEALGKTSFNTATQAFLKHLLILKIWNRTFLRLRCGLETMYPTKHVPFLAEPSLDEIRDLREFLQARLGTIEILGDQTPIGIFLRCCRTSAAVEAAVVAAWSNPERLQQLQQSQLLNEQDLDAFFAVIQRVFRELRDTRFFILMDDVSRGHIHFEMQKVLNSLIRSTQQRHCFKLTCDRYMYTLETSDGRDLADAVDATLVDLAEVTVKTGRAGKTDYFDHMAAVINRRLKQAQYNSEIRTILGESQKAREFLAALSLPRKRHSKLEPLPAGAKTRLHALYAGWNIIFSLSHGSIRTLLELLEHVFRMAEVTPDTISIPLVEQDRAVRSYSDRRFKSVAMTPGEVKGERPMKAKPLGEALQHVLSAIGQVSKLYLRKYDTGTPTRWYETITVERLDRRPLGQGAETILAKLVESNLLIDEGMTFSRSQLGLSQRYDLNKIFAPAFETTYRVRNHMYLSHRRLRSLLLTPGEFVAAHRAKLDVLAREEIQQAKGVLFDGHDGK